ncbi:MAG: hypothetical protein KDI19_12035 [Pseudomonadales bacterium]|nr:hypothetical protein [Pseudomonadales bacterium]
MSTVFTDNLFQVKHPEDIPLEELGEVMERDTWACIRGIVQPGEMLDALATIKRVFDPALDHPAVGQKAEAVRTNFQKLNIGGESRTANHDDARFFRAFYNPIWEPDIYGMRFAFTRLAQVRNHLAGMPIDFALDKIEANGLWTAARFHQYPAGGGFFRRHTDYVAKDIAEERSTRFYQAVLTMTEKGKHFHVGGGFVDVGEQRICLDDYAIPGDIILYDGRTVHGVEDIDPNVELDMNTINGRVAGFATLFKLM